MKKTPTARATLLRDLSAGQKPANELHVQAKAAHLWMQSFFRRLYDRMFAGRTLSEVLDQVISQGSAQESRLTAAQLRAAIIQDPRCYGQFCHTVKQALGVTEGLKLRFLEIIQAVVMVETALLSPTERSNLAKVLLDVIATYLWDKTSERAIFNALQWDHFVWLFSKEAHQWRGLRAAYQEALYNEITLELAHMKAAEPYNALEELHGRRKIAIYPFTGAQLLAAHSDEALEVFAQKRHWAPQRFLKLVKRLQALCLL